MIRLAAFVARGPNQAVLVVLAFAVLSLFLPLVGLLSSASAALVALRKGGLEAARVIGSAALVLAIAGALFSGSVAAPLLYGALLWVPIWIVALVLRQTYQFGWALELAAFMGLLGVTIVYAVVADPAEMWQERFRILLAPLLERSGSADLARIDQVGMWFAPYLTGIVAAGSVFSIALSLILARWWQAALFNPGGFAAEFGSMRLHKATHFFALGCLLLAYLGTLTVSEYFRNVLIVLCVPFVMLGLSIVHRLLSAKAGKRFWLAGLYVLATVVPQILVPVALLGITDAWVDWRQRWARPES